jgi:PAS domain S-box-containing protein
MPRIPPHWANLTLSFGIPTVFVLDLLTPLGLIVWLGYIPLLLTAVWITSKTASWWLGSLGTVLIGIGYVLSPPGIDPFIAITNRFIGAGLLWGTVIVVSTIKARQQKLREQSVSLNASEEQIRLFVERVQDYAIFMLDPQGHIITWNAGAERIKGYSRDEIIGQHISRFYTPNDQANGTPGHFLESAMRHGRAELEGWRVRKDGTLFWADVSLTALYDESGSPRGFTKITRDMTERRRAEEQLRQLAAQLEQRVQQRTAELEDSNAALQAFAYSVSHDLRAPLRTMQGFAKALLEDYEHSLDDTGRDYARRISRGAERMDALIQDLLAYSRLSRAEITREAVDLKTVLQEASKQVEFLLNESKGRLVIEPSLPLALGHRNTLVQVFSNLFANALKFTAPGIRPEVSVSCATQNGAVRISIDDNGIGVHPEHHQRIFNVFERLHGTETYPGTGMGLAIVKKGVERMGGRVGLESDGRRGSRFWVELQGIAAGGG